MSHWPQLERPVPQDDGPESVPPTRRLKQKKTPDQDNLLVEGFVGVTPLS
jgi:hypothetical protein